MNPAKQRHFKDVINRYSSIFFPYLNQLPFTISSSTQGLRLPLTQTKLELIVPKMLISL